MGIVNQLIINDAIAEAAATNKVVRASEARSSRKAAIAERGQREAAAIAMFADLIERLDREEEALRPISEVLTDFSDADEDFVDAETGESLFAGFSVRG